MQPVHWGTVSEPEVWQEETVLAETSHNNRFHWLWLRHWLTSNRCSLGPPGIPQRIPTNSWEYGFRKIPTGIPRIFLNFMVKNFNYALNAKQWYFTSTNDCFRISVTPAFLLLQRTAIQIGPSPTFCFMEWRHCWTFSELWMLNVYVWFIFCSSLSTELVLLCAIKYVWLDTTWFDKSDFVTTGIIGNVFTLWGGGILQLSNGNSQWPWCSPILTQQQTSSVTDRTLFLCKESILLWHISSLLPWVGTVAYYVYFSVLLMWIDFCQWTKCR